MKKLLLTLFCALPLAAMQETAVKIKATSLMVPKRLGNVSVLHDDLGFHVEQNGDLYEVNNGDIDKELRNISPHKLQSLLSKGYIAVNQSDNGDFSLKSHTRVRGGGFILAGIVYWATKTICYGTMVAGTTVAITAAAPALPVATAMVSTAITLSAGPSVAIASAGIAASSTLAPVAMATTITAGTGVGSFAAAIAGIEAAATCLSAFALALPTP